MPYPFTLPTTSYVSFPQYFTSNTHPSLPLSATSCRSQIRDALKQHKRLPPASRPGHLTIVLAALTAYVPYLFSLDAGLSGRPVSGEEVDLVLLKELEVEWRCTLTDTLPGRDPPRQRLKSLDTEITFTLQTLAYTYTLLAREQLRPLYHTNATPLADEQRRQAIGTAMQHLLAANSTHNHLIGRAGSSNTGCAQVVDISIPIITALASLALAEATLITVLKDDPYPTAVAESRNKLSKDWMFKAPDMPKVRAHLFARLCLAASEHAMSALSNVRNAKGIDEDLVRYLDNIRRTARAKGARFLAIDAEGQGKAGEAIAWIRGAMKELQVGGGEDSALKGFAKLKKDWREKREDKRIANGNNEWGSDGGRFEEGRVLAMLEKKWVKMNDTVSLAKAEAPTVAKDCFQVNVQLIPPFEPLFANMPSGREYHSPKPYQVPSLDEQTLARMRAPPEPNDDTFRGLEDDSGDEEDAGTPVGAFPGTKNNYANNSVYY